MHTLTALALLGALSVPLSSAHMLLAKPVPYGKSTLNNSPLNNAAIGSLGSDFPCKTRPGVYDVTIMNNVEVGVPQELSFTGGATHGGGSCQVSISLDKEPGVNSTWKVVHSIVGGCPASVDGNLSGNPNDAGASSFKWTLPAGMLNGQYTMAWTWFNKIGNREMYMNCAPITVTGGVDGDTSAFEKLPDMFVANLPREECNVPDSKNFIFPNPGDSVETAQAAALVSTLQGAGCAAMTTRGAGGAAPVAPTPAAFTSAASPPPASSSFASNPAISSPGSNTGGGSSNPDPSIPVLPSLITIFTVFAPAPAATKAPAAPAAPVSAEGKTPCPAGTADGALVCNGPLQFGLCNHGYIVWEAVASGTQCNNGLIAKRAMAMHGHHMRRARHWYAFGHSS